MKQYTATANDEGVRLSRFVQSVTRDLPTSLLYKSFRNKRIKVNGKKGAPEDRIQAGDLIELTAPATPTWWTPLPSIWPRKASTTPAARTASNPASATGWTGAPRAL